MSGGRGTKREILYAQIRRTKQTNPLLLPNIYYCSPKTGSLAPFLLAASTTRWYCTVRSTRAATATISISSPSPLAAAAVWSSSSDSSASQSQHPHLRYSSPKCSRNSLRDDRDPSVSVGFSRLSSWLMKRPTRTFVALTLEGGIR